MAGNTSDMQTKQLKEAAKTGWSGMLTFHIMKEQVGTIVMNAGRVAWAVCSYQPEDLGTFLWRIGKLSKSDLAQARQLKDNTTETRKMGVLLEEEGFIRKPTLRKCLLLHVRMAIGCLLRNQSLSIQASAHEFIHDEDFVFSVSEILAQDSIVPPPIHQHNLVPIPELASLSDFDGYQAITIVNERGSVVARHEIDDINVDETLPCKLADIMALMSQASSLASTGTVKWIISDCSNGALLTTYLDANKKWMAILVLSGDANLGMAKYRLSAILDSIVERLCTPPVPAAIGGRNEDQYESQIC